MDSFTCAFSGSTFFSDCDQETVSAYSDPDSVNGCLDLDAVDLPPVSNIQYPVIPNPLDQDSAEENDFTDAVLRYMHQVLMSDESDDEASTMKGFTLDAAVQSLYEVLRNKDPSSSSPNLPSETQTCWQFGDRIEETRKILPSEYFGTCDNECKGLTSSVAEEKERDLLDIIVRERNCLHREESGLEEGRSKKYFTVYAEELVLHEMFDRVLSLHRNALPNRVIVDLRHSEREKGSDDEFSYARKGNRKREAIDMRSLLMKCTQSVASNDHSIARNILKQIRLRSSPLGNGSQRLAHYFANGLEARLAGSGNLEYTSLAFNKSDVDVLKAYKVYLSVLPFMDTSYFFVNQVIMELATEATTLHIIHFGIAFGLQWPYLVQHLSTRPGGPPKLHITGIEFPPASLRQASRVNDTGSRLANCCERFNVPFEYTGIAQKWETIRVEDLRIETDAVIVVNCLYQSMFLLDDLITDPSPRDAFLNLIKSISPDIFIHGVSNGNHNSPYFVSRFREALFYYSSVFDMLEANLTRKNKERVVFERDVLGKYFFNVIACEGAERIVRPETYKQWQIRTVRAGFRQLPLNQEIMKEVKAKVKLCYHKGFFVKEESQWMLSGWKGRVHTAFSCWKAA